MCVIMYDIEDRPRVRVLVDVSEGSDRVPVVLSRLLVCQRPEMSLQVQ